MKKRGVADIIGAVLMVLTVLVSGAIVAYYTIQEVQNIDTSCTDALQAIDFKDLGYSCTMQDATGNKLTAFSILVSSESIEGFDLVVGDEGNSNSYEIKNGASVASVCLLNSKFGDVLSVPSAGNSRTYIVKGGVNKISISPILKGGKSCAAEARKSTTVEVSCVNPEVKNAIKACTDVPKTCGNGAHDVGEQCDVSAGDPSSCVAGYGKTCQYCDSNCHTVNNKGAYCGDNIVQSTDGEQCDDGNNVDNDICSNTCTKNVCQLSNARWDILNVKEGEVARPKVDLSGGCVGKNISFVVSEDDNNVATTPATVQPNDVTIVAGASTAQGSWTAQWIDDSLSNCVIGINCNPPEYSFVATIADRGDGSPASIQSSTIASELQVSACGDKIVDSGEQCDGSVGANTCSSVSPGSTGTLACYARGHVNSVGNSDQCTYDARLCTGGSTCGNGVVEVGETCDDHNTVNGDGCSSTCRIEQCTLSNARWDILSVRDGQIAKPIVDLSGDCSGRKISFIVAEDDSGIEATPATVQPNDVTIVTGASTAQGSWTAQWIDDSLSNCPTGNCNPPEYFFLASVLHDDGSLGTAVSSTSASDELKVSACGDKIVDSGEQCDSLGSACTVSTGAGTCSSTCSCTALPPVLTSTSWSKINAIEGDPITINTAGTNVKTLSLKLEIWEDDGGIGDDFITSITTNFDSAGSINIANYISPWQCDGGELGGYCLWGNPEFYVKAYIVGQQSSTEIRSGQLLVVTQKSPLCGNGFVQGTEQCDPPTGVCTPSYGSSCQYCAGSCNFATVQGGSCGDNIKNGNEQCDGGDLGGQTCISKGFVGGSLSCSSSCTFNTAACTSGSTCGNGVVEVGETCDGNNYGGASCSSLGFSGGSLSCSNCQIVKTSCTGGCGNGVIESGESCEVGSISPGRCVVPVAQKTSESLGGNIIKRLDSTTAPGGAWVCSNSCTWTCMGGINN